MEILAGQSGCPVCTGWSVRSCWSGLVRDWPVILVSAAPPHVAVQVVISSRRGCNPAGPRGGVQGTSPSLVLRPSGWQPPERREEIADARAT